MIFEQVQKLLAEQLNVVPESITRETNIVTDLHADSLDVVEMLMSLEDHFGITVPDEVPSTYILLMFRFVPSAVPPASTNIFAPLSVAFFDKPPLLTFILA